MQVELTEKERAWLFQCLDKHIELQQVWIPIEPQGKTGETEMNLCVLKQKFAVKASNATQ
ncbi:hypothetical protein KAR91_10665 [Candidatus Pacearchaeota archaeon]|nr:hypothetical protein [Candidatus Pacearchaeota archaeon]